MAKALNLYEKKLFQYIVFKSNRLKISFKNKL